MTKDIAPELIATISTEFQKKMAGSSKIKSLDAKIRNRTATYRDAQEYAIKVSELMSEALLSNLSADMLPDGKMYYNIAQRVMQEALGKNGIYGEIGRYCSEVQQILNKEAEIGIKAMSPELKQDRINGIVDIVSGKDDFNKIKYMLKEPLVNFGQSIVDEAVRSNADFQYKAGLSPKIVRTSTGNCCEWCDKLAGTYEYSDVRKTGNNVWRRHSYCRCLVDYHPGNGKKQNAHTKIWENESERDKIRLRKIAGLALGEQEVVRYIKENIIPAQNTGVISPRQDIHRKGSNLYEERSRILSEKGQFGPSYVTISDESIMKLVREYSGKGIIKYNRKGEWNFQEIIVTNDTPIGVVIDNRNGNSAVTSVFKIHYGKNGVHIVPDYPSKKR